MFRSLKTSSQAKKKAVRRTQRSIAKIAIKRHPLLPKLQVLQQPLVLAVLHQAELAGEVVRDKVQLPAVFEESVPVVCGDVVGLQPLQISFQLAVAALDAVNIVLLVVGEKFLQFVMINTDVAEEILLECECLVAELT